MESKNLFSAWRKAGVYSVLAAAIGLMASCGTTKNTESGDTIESDTSTTQPFPEPETESPTPIDTMGQ